MQSFSGNTSFYLALSFWLTALLFSFEIISAQDFEFASLRGTPINTTGWNLQGNAKVGNSPGSTGNGEIVLTEAINTQSGAIFFNTPINLSQCKKWIAEFEFRIFNGNAADGIAFCYLDVPPSGFVSGGGIGIPATANGLKVVLDTWRNCGTDAVPKLQIRWGAGYDECNGQPTRNNNDGQLNFIRSNSFNRCRIEYNEGNIKVFLNGIEYLSGFQTFTFTGYFGFTASTGGSNDVHSIKNVRIFTEMPPSAAGSDAGFCPGGSALIGTSSTQGYTYRWSPQAGLSNPNISNPTVTLGNSGEADLLQQYIVETAFSDRPGCSSRDSVLIRVFANPRPDFSHDTVCLPGGNIHFKNTSRFQGVIDTTNLTWQWDFGDPSSGSNNFSDQTSPFHFYNGASPFNVSLAATSVQGCSGSVTKTIQPVVPPPQVSFLFEGDTCSGYDITFTGEVTQSNNFPLRYSWDFGDGQTSQMANPVHRFGSGGTYPVLFSVSSPYCTSNIFSRTISIRPSPELSTTGAIPAPCINDAPFALNQVSVTNGLPGTGFYSGNAVQNNLFFPPEGIEGSNPVKYDFLANNGCRNSLDFEVVVNGLPEINAGPDKVSLEQTPVSLEGSAGSNTESFVWLPNQFLSSNTTLNPLANPPVNQWYILSGVSAQGCVSEDSVFVTVLPALFIPNAFSPNGDGINDVWVIRHLSDYPGSVVRVFDRFGRLVFSSTGYNNPWDGKANGVEVPTGVYYYIVDPKNGATIRQGSITVLR